jgi:hypothetical protein
MIRHKYYAILKLTVRDATEQRRRMHADHFYNLAIALCARYEFSGDDVTDLETALSNFRHAMDLGGRQHPNFVTRFVNYSSALRRLYDTTGSSEYISEAERGLLWGLNEMDWNDPTFHTVYENSRLFRRIVSSARTQSEEPQDDVSVNHW